MEDQNKHEQIFSYTSIKKKTQELRIEGRKIAYQDKAGILGFKFRRSGYPRGI